MDVIHVFRNSQVLYQNQTGNILNTWRKYVWGGFMMFLFVLLALYGDNSVIIQCWIKNPPKGQLLRVPLSKLAGNSMSCHSFMFLKRTSLANLINTVCCNLSLKYVRANHCAFGSVLAFIVSSYTLFPGRVASCGLEIWNVKSFCF